MKTRFLLLILFVGSAALVLAGEGSAKDQIHKLYADLAEKRSAQPFVAFFDGSLTFKQKPEAIKAMDVQAKSALDYYGPAVAMEIIQEESISESLIKLRWLTRHNDEVPLFWSALFYKRAGKWEPLSVFFFDDPAKAGL